ncbi:MAG: AtpZ/AtpI family protein [Nitrospinae bacterium]|nr:AtpZ/AtpI family protein [Nitrospinota bacterium]MBI3814877.1 AtpZ/AtpI family protein [Nitrospinota bacterium]
MDEDDKKGKFRQFRELYLISTVGIQLVVSIFIGLAIGVYLDGKFGTSPIFTFIFLLLGIAAGFMNLFRVAKGGGNTDNDR